MRFSFLFIGLFLVKSVFAQLLTPFEQGNGNQSATYAQCISYYKQLDEQYPGVKMYTCGLTDCGQPLHLVVISNKMLPNEKEIGDYVYKKKKEHNPIMLVMNGIHPGEPEGIDASMMWARDLAVNKPEWLNNVTVCIIPVYNIGGALNRGCCSRSNQNGPEEYGFRGNAKNYDLNRDFIKADTKNTWAFWEIFHTWKPDVFIDNHTTNGADYQHVMTLISSQRDKQDVGVKRYVDRTIPMMYDKMKDRSFQMCPYVNVWGSSPDSGFAAFFESPRYSTGYASLFGCVSFVAETHMFKPFFDRVQATYQLMDVLLEITSTQSEWLMARHAITAMKQKKHGYQTIAWQHDKKRYSLIDFKGYTATYKKSEITGQTRLFYDRSQPWQRKIKYFDRYNPSDSVTRPFAYVIPQAWSEVIERLDANKCYLRQLAKDTSLMVESYKINSFKASETLNEGHFPISKVDIIKDSIIVKFRKGDYLAILPNRFVIETLEPKATDAFLYWNFFNPILQQKEWFSDYVFEDLAADYLKQNPELLKALSDKKKTDPVFAKDAFAQLYFIYQRSPWFEESFMQYPIYRLPRLINLNLVAP